MNDTEPLSVTHGAAAVTAETLPAAPAVAAVTPGGETPTVTRRYWSLKPGSELHSAGARALRTFSQSFLAVVSAGLVLKLNISIIEAGATAGLAAVLALANRLLDDSPFPTIPKG
jgi:hypothetical protein